MRSVVPQTTKNVLRIKDVILQPEANDSYYRLVNPSNVLYQKAQNDVLTHKQKPLLTDKTSKGDYLLSMNLQTPMGKESPKGRAKLFSAMNNYVSPSNMTTIHSSQSKLSKKGSLKAALMIIPIESKKENHVNISRDDILIKKPQLKLNINSRGQDTRLKKKY